ncbi:MAG TPA: S41 family peptidase [Pyrinomonadaceae bacterium]|nr:S41 family peptidase [Pyrinomonadaceae bacterium]
MKIRRSSFLSLLLALTLSLPALIYGQQGRTSRPSTDNPPNPPSASGRTARRTTPPSTEAVERDVAEALTVIQDNYIDGPKLDYNNVFKSSITGMLRALDPHSDYFDAAEYEAFRTEQRSEYFGIGATIGDLTEGDRTETYIRATFERAPAHRAGLRFGDHIVEVDGKSMRGKPYPEVRQHLLGPRGSVVKVTVEHPNGQVETVQITRDAVPQPSIPEVYMIRPGVGYVAMTGGFNFTTADEFNAALDNLQAQGMKMLVLDLRGNRGGLLIQAVRVANTFLQRGQLIVTQKGRIEGSSEVYRAINETPDTTPLVVLVDRSTASAAEIVAGALQDHDRALIVGETSFGKGLVQLPYQVGHGSALLLTIAKYFTPSGRLIQRDYTNAGFYDYYTRGGSLNSNTPQQQRPPAPVGPESRTDTGRTVYGGGGITPDEAVTPRTVTPAQQRLVDPVFAFALELTAGRIQGFDAYQVQRAIDFDRDLRATDYPMTDALYKSFKDFVARKPAFKLTPAQLDRDRAYIELRLRYELATAAYGAITSLQVFNTDDPQIARAVDLLPRARELALAAQRIRNPSE